MSLGAVLHPIEVRDALLRALSLAGEPRHPFWARGFEGRAAVQKLAATLYTWLTGVVPDPDRDDDARGGWVIGVNLASIRSAAPVVPRAVALVVEEALVGRIGDLAGFERRLTTALVETAEPDTDETDPGRRRTTQELIDSSMRRRRDGPPRARPEAVDGYLSPWKPVADGDALLMALKLELAEGHLLEGRTVRALARRSGSSEVLFELLDDAPVVAVVHLRWAPPERGVTHLPWTRLYQDIEAWRDHCEAADHALWRKSR